MTEQDTECLVAAIVATKNCWGNHTRLRVIGGKRPSHSGTDDELFGPEILLSFYLAAGMRRNTGPTPFSTPHFEG
jgi:hypothetical protein